MPSQLSERLSSLAADVSRAARPVPAEDIRRRAKTRHQTRIALAGIVTGVATLSAAAILIASTGPSPVPIGEPRVLPTEISDDLHMPHEGELGWVLDDDPLAASVFNPCGGTDVTLHGRVDARTESGPGFQGPGPDAATTRADQVLLFRTERDALAALQSLASETLDDGCGWSGGYGPQYFDYGRTALTALYLTDEPPVFRHVIVTPRGNALIIVSVATTGVPVQDVDPVNFLADPLCATMGLCEERLCYNGPLPSPGDGQAMPNPVPCLPSANPSDGPVGSIDPGYPSGWPGDNGASPSEGPNPKEGSASPLPSAAGSPEPSLSP